MEQFPSNARKPLAAPAASAETPRMKPVVSPDEVKRMKTPMGRRLLKTFFGGDSSTVVGYLLNEVVVPAGRDFIVNFVRQGVERAVYGEVRTPITRSGQSGPTNYNGINRSPTTIVRGTSPWAAPTAQNRAAATQPSAVDIGVIVIDSQIKAQQIAENLLEWLQEYKSVSVATLNDALGQTGPYTDGNYGWVNLDAMNIVKHPEGWQLIMPPVISLR